MEYEYTANDRMQEPHNYMYSQFAGQEFLTQYKRDRLLRLGSITRTLIEPSSANEALSYRALIEFLTQEADSPPVEVDVSLCTVKTEGSCATRPEIVFSLDEPVETMTLLDFLLYSLLNEQQEQAGVLEARFWTNLLIQRFEVSKRLWSQYLAGFRKGEGSDTDVDLYYRFALLLALAYVRSGGLQYLSTLLKVNDLLLSLRNSLHTDRTHCSLVLAVATELCAVQKLTPIPEAKYGPFV